MLKKLNQQGFHLLFVVLVVVVVVAIGFVAMYVAKATKGDSGEQQKQGLSKDQVESLPDITYFKDHKSNSFIVDYSTVKWGNPYKGSRANTPHNGAHVQFQDAYKDWPKGGAAPSDYPPIYSPVDGIVDRVEYSMKTGDHDQYSVGIAFAKSGSDSWSFSYSFEPFIKEPSPGFYKNFLIVKQGDRVKEGQIIGYMYLVKDADQLGAHIHYHIAKAGSDITYPPAIFSQKVMDEYYARWGGTLDGFEGKGDLIPECMGYKLTAAENPFGTGAVDCLN